MAPKKGDRVMVFKRNWADLILSGVKKMEVRSCRYKEGNYCIGHRERIIGKITLGEGIHIKNTEEWQELRPLHCCEDDELPYKKTRGLQISNVEVVSPEIPYKHPKGAIGIVIYK